MSLELEELAYDYQVGGGLPYDSPTYVTRQADADLYEGTLTGKFCYVLNSRQMGKSSLRVRTMQRLQAKRVACGVIDLMGICSQDITRSQWYASLIYTLASSFNLLDQFNVVDWWHSRQHLSPVQCLSEFIRDVLLVKVPQNLVIFVDEVDSVLNLNFPVDEFFALIQACHNQRANYPEYQRLSWVLLGVATPAELMRGKERTLFNQGQEIHLTGFRLYECSSLMQGLAANASHPQAVLAEILAWTGGKPFLTQKLCRLIARSNDFIPAGAEAAWVAQLVREKIIDNWEVQDEPEHFRSMRDRILQGATTTNSRLLEIYGQILHQGEILADDSPEQMELRLAGLVVKESMGKLYAQPILRVYNRIYQEIFNLNWLKQQRGASFPPPPQLDIQSGQDEQLIYNHFLNRVQHESPTQILERCQRLFIDGIGYPDSEIAAALRRIVVASPEQPQFNSMLNRCCYIIINHWKIYALENAIASLITLFKTPPKWETLGTPPPESIKHLRELIRRFTDSEEYLTLQRLFIEPLLDDTNTLLQTCIHRYPFLYHHYFLNKHSSYEHQQQVQQLQSERQWQYALNLSQYATYLIQQEKTPKTLTSKERFLQPVPNPTLLSNEDVYQALKQFVGKVEGSSTYKDLAQTFLTRKVQSLSYRDFKRDLYEYLIAAIDSDYGKHQFNQRLYQFLKNTFPERDSQVFTETALRDICRRLCRFLIESPQHPNHLHFLDLISNLGPLRTTALLLKIVLLSGNVKPELEGRFSLLFNHYESQTIDNNRWLVNSLENLNIAFVVNFGSIDLSFIELNLH